MIDTIIMTAPFAYTRIGTTFKVSQYTFTIPENDIVTVVPRNKDTVIDGPYKKIVTPEFTIYFGPSAVFKGVLHADIKLFDHNDEIYYLHGNVVHKSGQKTIDYVGIYKNYLVFKTDTAVYKVIDINNYKIYKKMPIAGPISKVYIHKVTAVIDQSTEYNPHKIKYSLNVVPEGLSRLTSIAEKYVLPWFNIRVINARSSEKMLVTNIRKDAGIFLGSLNAWMFLDGTYIIAMDNSSPLNYFEYAKKAD